MNFSEIELFEIARLIKEEEKKFAQSVRSHLSHSEDLLKTLDDITLFYAREEKQKKLRQKICSYIDNEETLAYLKENFADILSLPDQHPAHATPAQIKDLWISKHRKVLSFFENLLSSSADPSLREDIHLILERERTWHETLQQAWENLLS